MLRQGARAALVALLLAALALVLLKAFAGDVYRVDSASMEPTIHGSPAGGERVLVRYGRPRLRRFDLVVVMRPDAREPLVKRVVGLPGESVRIRGGDVLIDGRRLAPAVQRPPPVALFESARAPLPGAFPPEWGAWQGDAAPWRLDARERPRRACYAGRVTDAFPGPGGELVAAGERQVGDALLELELTLEQAGPAARLALALTEEGDTFLAELEPRAGAAAVARLVRERAGAPREVLSEGALPFDAGRPWRLVFANLDNGLLLHAVPVDGSAAIAVALAAYDHNAPLEASAPAQQHLVPRACLEVRDAVLALRSLRVARDLHYTDAGRFGTAAEVQLGPDEIFVLGDNSAQSQDSRHWGPVPLDTVLGVPLAVVWPPASWRRLEPRGFPGPVEVGER